MSVESVHVVLRIQGNGRLKVYDIEAKCFESDIKITESRSGRSVRLVRVDIKLNEWC